jgi:hypothetical protein
VALATLTFPVITAGSARQASGAAARLAAPGSGSGGRPGLGGSSGSGFGAYLRFTMRIATIPSAIDHLDKSPRQ